MSADTLELPKMKSVVSSNILEVGHDPEKSHLFIRFKAGSTYRYDGVSTGMYQDMLAAESIGRYHAQVIKKLPYVKVG
jgi:hypothetical protein